MSACAPTTDVKRIAVVGAGIAGLSAAYELAQTDGIGVTLFEAAERLGGTVETVTFGSSSGEPFVVECGPDSWVTEKQAARDLAEELGLASEIIHSNDARRRNYLARGRSLTPMPDGMRMMVPTRWAPILDSPLFSWQARLAYLREPRRADELKAHALAQPAEFDESVASFVRRHFGAEAAETIAGPLLAGVFGGDIERLSACAVLAPFVRMEREHGSLVTAVMQRERRQAEQGAALPVFTTLRSGLGTLIARMADAIGEENIRRGARVTSLSRVDGKHGWRLCIEGRGSGCTDEIFDGVVLATPAHGTRALIEPMLPKAAALLDMEATSAIVVALGYEPETAARLRLPSGFGFLVPPAAALGSAPSLLAGTFMHQKFPDRAPKGGALLRGFFGGLSAPAMMDWPDEQILAAARTAFSLLLGPLPVADHTLVRRWLRSLPQYAVGHPERMRQLDEHMARQSGLLLTGNAYHGVGLPNLIEQGRTTARRMAALPALAAS